MYSRAPISGLVSPSDTRRLTLRSMGVSDSHPVVARSPRRADRRAPSERRAASTRASAEMLLVSAWMAAASWRTVTASLDLPAADSSPAAVSQLVASVGRSGDWRYSATD